MEKNLIAEIEERSPEFSKSQRYIADFIIKHYEKAAFMTAAKLGAAVGVSESTVVRFAIEMGYEGYPEMQRALRDYSRNRLTSLQRLDISNDRFSGGNLIKTIMSQDIDRIRHTLEAIPQESFDAAIDHIVSAHRIYIFGAMSSSILATFLDNYLKLAFDNVIYVEPINSSGILRQLIHVNEKDVFISISFPRYSRNTLTATAYAKKCGADIISITDSDSSPLAEYADQLLPARSDMASYADSLVAPLSLINAVIAAVGQRCSAQLEDTLSRLETLLDENDAYIMSPVPDPQ